MPAEQSAPKADVPEHVPVLELPCYRFQQIQRFDGAIPQETHLVPEHEGAVAQPGQEGDVADAGALGDGLVGQEVEDAAGDDGVRGRR